VSVVDHTLNDGRNHAGKSCKKALVPERFSRSWKLWLKKQKTIKEADGTTDNGDGSERPGGSRIFEDSPSLSLPQRRSWGSSHRERELKKGEDWRKFLARGERFLDVYFFKRRIRDFWVHVIILQPHALPCCWETMLKLKCIARL
jgi:hypothetical protein